MHKEVHPMSFKDWISPPCTGSLRKIIVKRKREIDVPFCYRLEYNIGNGHERRFV